MNPSTSPSKFRLKQPIIDEWSIREKLALASAQLKGLDQNYASMSKLMKPFEEPYRPQDWFSSKNCALQYDELLEKVAMPKRKRGERGEETAELIIVRDLTNKRTEELKHLIAEKTQKLRETRSEYELATGPNPPEELLKAIWQRKLDQEKQAVVDEEKRKEFLEERTKKQQAAKLSTRAALMRTPSRVASTLAVTPPQIFVKTESDAPGEVSNAATPLVSPTGSQSNQTSPLLTSLLQSPSSSSSPAFGSKPGEAVTVGPTKTFPSTPSRTPVSSRPTSPAASPATAIESSSPGLSKLLDKNISPAKSAVVPTVESVGYGDALSRSEVISKRESISEVKTETSIEEGKSPQTRRRGRSSVTVASATTTPAPTSERRETRRSGRIKVTRDSESDSAVTQEKKSSVTSEHDVFVSEESMDSSNLKIPAAVRAPSTTFDSVPNSPASSTMYSEDTDAVREHRRWQKAISEVLKEARVHRFAKNFLVPVTDKEVEGYSDTVKRPMDLSTIKKRLETPSAENAIRTTAEFQRDVMLMFQNALIYNKPDHEVYKEALEMQKDILDILDDFIEKEKERESISPAPTCFSSAVSSSATGGKTSSSNPATHSGPPTSAEGSSTSAVKRERRGMRPTITSGPSTEEMSVRRRSRTSTDTDPGSTSVPMTRFKKKAGN